MISSNVRNTQFAEFAKLLADELPDPPTDDSVLGIAQAEWRAQVELLIARRVYDLAMFIVAQAYKDELKPNEILCKDGKPILMYPENLKEWYDEKYEQ